jgi:hypothetical protein
MNLSTSFPVPTRNDVPELHTRRIQSSALESQYHYIKPVQFNTNLLLTYSNL